MTAALAIERLADGRARLRGRLGFGEVAAVLPRGAELIAGRGTDGLELDVAGLQGIDSATLALLLAWAAEAAQAGTRLRLAQAPDGLRALAQLCDAGPLLGLA
ncbi:STAS domain-containing protein [Dokdonella sp.]|uniref:STAS domain-containing protein n=1 Tax=Dokdonella sp. TaxID=2291710 RepID=UPI0031C0E858|nr:STAS domain-containing protein [Dokdonella sp.]